MRYLLLATSLLVASPLLAQTRRATTTKTPPATRYAAPAQPLVAPVRQPTTPAPVSAAPASAAPVQQQTAPVRATSYRTTTQTQNSVSPGSKSSVFKVNVLSPIVRTVSAFYEHATGPTSSMQLGVYYTGISLGDLAYRGFGITPEYRFYLTKRSDAPDGAYLAPFVRYQNLTFSDVTDASSKFTLSTVGGGLLIGRQWLVGRSDNVAIDLFGGPSYNVAKVGDGYKSDAPTAFAGFGVRFGLCLGLAW